MLRDDFDMVLKQFGYNVLLVRQNKTLRCNNCWNEKQQEGSRDCPVCFGLGWMPIFEKHTCRSRTMSIPQTLPRAIEDIFVGHLEVGARAYYFRYNVPIDIKDLIVEVQWDKQGRPVYMEGYILQINYIDTNQYEDGQLTYLKAYVEDTPGRRDIRGHNIIHAIQNMKNYALK